jgi:hypothetical protein
MSLLSSFKEATKDTSLVLNEKGQIDENQSNITLTMQDAERLEKLLDAKNKYNNLKNPNHEDISIDTRIKNVKVTVNERIKQNCEAKLKFFEDKINLLSKLQNEMNNDELVLQKQKHDNELKFQKRKNVDKLQFLKKKKRIEMKASNINFIFIIIIMVIIGFISYRNGKQ